MMHQLMTGVMAQNGICVHGLMIDILRIANVNGSSALPFELYYTTSKVVGGYDALVSPGPAPLYITQA